MKHRARPFVVLAVLLAVGGCAGQDPAPTGVTPAASEPAGSVPETTDAAFPLTITRRGGFAGVDDRAEITADGTAVVTRGGQAPVRRTLPAATVTEIRGLLTAPGFAAPASPSPPVTTCNDGYEYGFVSPASTTELQDCGDPGRPAAARMLAIAGEVFNG